MQAPRAEVRHQLAAFDPCREARRPAAAELGAGSAPREDPVQEDRQLELVAEQVAEHERLGAGRAAIALVEVHDRRDVERADARVDALVAACMSIRAIASARAARTRRRELARRARRA